jgi:hypothetical protein
MGDPLYSSHSDFTATRLLSRIMAALEADTRGLYVGVLVARLMGGYQMDEID